jgi:formylglycine-generating enzyme
VKVIKGVAFLLAVFIAAIFFSAREVQASAQSLELIVDFSESMDEMIGNKSKIAIARELANGILDKIQKPMDIGLSLYGHRDKDKCGDVELVVPVKGQDKQAIKGKLTEYSPRGKASPNLALQEAAERLKNNNDYRNIILITDGKNICDGDIIKTVREIRKVYDFRFIVHMILLNPGDQSSFTFKTATRSTYGTFSRILNERDIATAIGSIAELLNTVEAHKPRTVLTDEMVLVPAGEFSMGNDDPIFDPLERPRHTVYLDAFYIDKYEVTQSQYRKVMDDVHSWWIGSDLPIDSVTWHQAKEYCEKVGKRLPTEAEWEKAAKGGRDDKWSGTNDLDKLEEYAWIDDTGAHGETHPVGQRKPNSYGIYDMCGNVWEWVSDWYGADFYKNSPNKNPQGPDKGFLKILRGGNWDSHQYEVRTTSRYPKEPDVEYANNGFRCAKSIASSPDK